MAVTGITSLYDYDDGSDTATLSVPLASSTVGGAGSNLPQSTTGWDTQYSARYRNNGSPSTGLLGAQAILGVAGSGADLSGANTFLAIIYRVGTFSKYAALSSTQGIKVLMNSSALGTEEALWPVDGSDTIDNNFNYTVAVINANRSTDASLYTGTFDPADVTNIGVVADFGSGFGITYVDSAVKITPLIVTGDDGGTAYEFSAIVDYCLTFDIPLITELGSTRNCPLPIQIGDGSTATKSNGAGLSYIFPAKPTYSAPKLARTHIDDNDIGWDFNGGASDVCDYDGASWTYLSRQYFIMQGTGYAIANCSVTGSGTTQVGDGWPLTGWTFDDCNEIEVSQPTLTSCTIRNAAAVGLLIDTDNGLVNCTTLAFNGNVTAIEVEITGDPATCDIDVSTHTFDSSNTTELLYSGTGTLTITATAAQASAFTTSAPSGTIVFATPVSTFTLNSSESSSLIQIFTTTTQTVLSTATGTVDTFAHGDETVDYVVQKAGFLPQRVVGFALSGNQTVNVTLAADPVYDSGNGLTYTTDFTYDPAVPELILATRQEGRDFYSALIDAFIAQSTLFNKPFLFSAVGPDSIFFTGDNEIASGDLDNWKGAGIRYVTTAGATAAEWISFKSSGDNTTGVLGEYQQSDGGDLSDARATGNFDQIIAIYGDSTHGSFDFRSHMVGKFQPNPYLEARVDVLDSFGITALEPFEYVVAMSPTLLGVAAGDPAITLTVVDHTGAPLVVGGKSFDYEIQGGGADSGTAILREWNYNKSLDATMYTKDPFDWPDAIREAGSAFETAYGDVEGSPTGLHGFYVSRSGADHPDFVQFQSNDGTYYVPAVTANISGSGMPVAAGADTRLQITNDTAKAAGDWLASTAYALGDQKLRTSGIGAESTAGLYMVCTTAGTSNTLEPTWDTTVGNTTADTNGTGAGDVVWTTYAILFYDADPASASYSGSYIEGEEFSTGDTFGIRFSELDGATTFKIFETTGITASTGFSFAVVPVADSIYASNAVDGSAVTQFTADYTNNEVDLSADADFTAAQAYAFYCFTLTSSLGMYQFWGGISAPDVGNYKIVTATLSLKFDNTTTGSVVQTDSARIYRDDDVYPVKDPTTSGYGVQINWQLPVYSFDGGGGGFTSGDRATLVAVPDAAANATAVQASATTTPLASNVKEMNDATVYGDGTELDKWTGEAP